jgi:hypothetical protein
MRVYLLIHDDGGWTEGDMEIRGVFQNRAIAEASIVTITPAGRKSMAPGAHDDGCCYVDEREVMEFPLVDVRENLPPPDPNATPIIREDVADAFVQNLLMPTWFSQLDRVGLNRPIGRVTDIEEGATGVTFTVEVEEPDAT